MGSVQASTEIGDDIAALLRKGTTPVELEVAVLAGQVAGLTALVQQLLTAPPVPLTPGQFSQLIELVQAAARQPGERIAAALAAAGEALGEADDPEPA